jgi:phage-related protein (TIGR01555 family)
MKLESMAQDKKTIKELTIKEQLKNDGYIDTAKKIGQKVSGNTGFNLKLASDSNIASIYVGNGLAKRYIDLVVDDMIRQWITIPEDTDGKVLNYLKKLQAKKEFKNALRTSKLFGGSLIFMVIEDGKLPNEPVDLNNIKSIHKLKYFSRKHITIDSLNYYDDSTQANYGDPKYFTVTNNGKLEIFHESRCLVFTGEYYPQDELAITPGYEKYWGLSILQSLHETFEDYGLALQALFRSLLKANIDVLKIKNLMALLASKDGQKQLDARAQIFDLAKSVSTTLLLDNDESFEAISQQLNGIAEVFGKLQETLAGMTGVPSTILFGTGAKGLQADGSGEMRIYYDKIKSDQEEDMLVQLEKLIKIISYAQDSELSPDEEYNIEFNSLWQQTDEEKVKMRMEQAKIDEIYINAGVVDPNEIRNSRFGNDKYSIETDVEGDAPELPEQPGQVNQENQS